MSRVGLAVAMTCAAAVTMIQSSRAQVTATLDPRLQGTLRDQTEIRNMNDPEFAVDPSGPQPDENAGAVRAAVMAVRVAAALYAGWTAKAHEQPIPAATRAALSAAGDRLFDREG